MAQNLLGHVRPVPLIHLHGPLHSTLQDLGVSCARDEFGEQGRERSEQPDDAVAVRVHVDVDEARARGQPRHGHDVAT